MNDAATTRATYATSVHEPGHITCQTPVLQIAKTPDGGTITAGDTATFTVGESDVEGRRAKGGAISGTLQEGGGGSWRTATGGCTVAGTVGSHVLGDSIGATTMVAHVRKAWAAPPAR